jgi:hypothetical protein
VRWGCSSEAVGEEGEGLGAQRKSGEKGLPKVNEKALEMKVQGCAVQGGEWKELRMNPLAQSHWVICSVDRRGISRPLHRV